MEVLSRLVDISSWVVYMHIPDESKLDPSPIDMGRRPTVYWALAREMATDGVRGKEIWAFCNPVAQKSNYWF